MNKRLLACLILLISFQEVYATHTKGGWMYYEFLGKGVSDPTKLRYKIGLVYYVDCGSTIVDDPFIFTLFSGAAPFNFIEDFAMPVIISNPISNCVLQSCYPCINFIPTICYNVIQYETIVELAPSPFGYIISKQRCCRTTGISNLEPNSNTLGATYTIKIPGFNQGLPNAHVNKSPQFIFNDTSIVCGNNAFSLNFSATDSDGDSLVYSFCNAFDGASPDDPNPNPANAPPYNSVPYLFPFTGSQPLGSGVSINPTTGIISGIAPPSGEYVISICVDEYRQGIKIASSRKELHLNVADCAPVQATLNPNFTTCGDLTLNFSNQTDNPFIQSWLWVFGDPSTGNNDTSKMQFPTHTFSTAGVYNVRLFVNLGLACADSALQVVNVFPGFFPGFAPLAPFCVGQPIAFDDTTRTNYGVVSNWSWNFGDPATLTDTSHLENPFYTYTLPGTYTVKLVVGNSKGCIDSLTRTVTVLAAPTLSVFPRDTTYCSLDSLRLTATGTGSFTWLPNIAIAGAGTATPLVFPSGATVYYVTLNNLGCKARDSIRVNPINDVTNAIAANPASICEGDTLTLTGTSNKTNVTWQWSPMASLLTPNAQTSRAFPIATTNYTLSTKWGNNCFAMATKNIPVTPLAIANAGPDTSYCAGQPGITLSASGGVSYQWTPTAGLSNPNIANPMATPAVTTNYIVSVGVNGCSRLRSDTVKVTVRQKPLLQLPRDTLICVIDTLKLTATGMGNFLWSPAYNISNVNIRNPLVSPDVPTGYRVRLTDIFNCFSDDSVFVDVKPDVFVNAGNDTSICRTDSLQLSTISDGLNFTWSPTIGLSNPFIKNPVATPLITTQYTVTANIGKCQRTSAVKIFVAPLPPAQAGPDVSVCNGFSTSLMATGGSQYVWTPAIYLSNANIANPQVLQPLQSTLYVVTVTDTLGCSRAVKDSVLVKVSPKVNIDAGPANVAIIAGQSFPLFASGGITYLWSPNLYLNNANVQNPVTKPLRSILYTVTGVNAFGCTGTDSIMVNLYDLEADIYVPTAFTPNGDGLNDEIKPILLGMKELNFFRIYNRYGELVFETKEMGKGWNGFFKGQPQTLANFVWVARGVTFKGEIKRKRGNLILIR